MYIAYSYVLIHSVTRYILFHVLSLLTRCKLILKSPVGELINLHCIILQYTTLNLYCKGWTKWYRLLQVHVKNWPRLFIPALFHLLTKHQVFLVISGSLSIPSGCTQPAVSESSTKEKRFQPRFETEAMKPGSRHYTTRNLQNVPHGSTRPRLKIRGKQHFLQGPFKDNQFKLLYFA